MNGQDATTEKERCLASADIVGNLLQDLGILPHDRRLVYFTWLCCERILHLLHDARSRRAVETLRRLVDSDIEPGELAVIRREAEAAYQQAATAYQNGLGSAANCNATAAAYSAIAVSVNDDWGLSFEITYSDAASEASRRAAHAIADTSPNQWMSVNAAERTRQASMIRCLFDDQSRSVFAAPANYPTTVVQLAQSLYDGQDCAFALHDALLDAGLTEFAEHFRQEAWHPKGCWALDLLLDKR